MPVDLVKYDRIQLHINNNSTLLPAWKYYLLELDKHIFFW